MELIDQPIGNNPDNYKACYHCQNTNYKKIKFTFWGGIIGPKILHHLRCQICHKTYNGKTGKSNFKAILFFNFISLILMIGILVFFNDI